MFIGELGISSLSSNEYLNLVQWEKEEGNNDFEHQEIQDKKLNCMFVCVHAHTYRWREKVVGNNLKRYFNF